MRKGKREAGRNEGREGGREKLNTSYRFHTPSIYNSSQWYSVDLIYALYLKQIYINLLVDHISR